MKTAFFTFFLLVTSLLSAQDAALPATLLSKAQMPIQRYLGPDAFGYQYSIADNEFRKEKNGIMQKYRNLALGEITRADLQNPLQIVLFYKRFNTVVLLDNQLNETTRINFSDVPQPLITEAAGLASQNRLWLYDITTQQIGVYDLAQNSFKTLTPPFTDGIKYYHSDYNYFYWIDTAGGCYAVNLFGKVSFLGAVPAYSSVQMVSQDTLLLQKEGGLYLLDLQTGREKAIAIVEKSFESFYYSAQILSIFTGTEIIQYKITLPQ